MEQQNTNQEERDLMREIEQLQNLKNNKTEIEALVEAIKNKKGVSKIGIYNNAGETVVNLAFFENGTSFIAALEALALADLNKQLAKIDQEIKARLRS